MRDLVLTGFMATGKSTIAALVAQRTGLRWVDTDRYVERAAGCSVAEIFAREGEAGFRARERQACAALAAERGVVVSTGGGALLVQENRRCFDQVAVIVCLVADEATLGARLSSASGRPLASDWVELLRSRAPGYATFEHQVEVSARSVEEIAEEVIQLWRRESKSPPPTVPTPS